MAPETTTSTEIYLWYLARELARQRHEVTVVSYGGKHAPRPPPAERDGVRFRYSEASYSPEYVRFACDVLRREGPWDAIHVDWWFEIAAAAKRAAPDATICTFVHSPHPFDEHFRPKPLDAGKMMATDLILTNSAYMVGVVSALGPSIADKVRLTGLGVDTRLFAPATTPDRRAAVVAVRDRFQAGNLRLIVFPSRVEKGLLNLQRAVMALPGQIRREVAILVVGWMPPEGSSYGEFREVLRLYRNERCPMRWTGSVRQYDMPPYYCAGEAHSAVATIESFGLTNIEAMACGLPVIAANTGGPRDVVRDGDNGLLVPPNDPKSLAAALERVLTDRALARRISENGRRDAVGKWDWAIVAKRFVEAYGTRDKSAGGSPPGA